MPTLTGLAFGETKKKEKYGYIKIKRVGTLLEADSVCACVNMWGFKIGAGGGGVADSSFQQ